MSQCVSCYCVTHSLFKLMQRSAKAVQKVVQSIEGELRSAGYSVWLVQTGMYMLCWGDFQQKHLHVPWDFIPYSSSLTWRPSLVSLLGQCCVLLDSSRVFACIAHLLTLYWPLTLYDYVCML